MIFMDPKTESTPAFDFSGSIPRHYEQCLGPMFFEPYAIEVSTRVDPSSVKLALELASGTGRVTRHLRRVIPPAAKLIASDVSEDMLSVAKEKLKDLDIDWQFIDAQELPFTDNSIDLVVCCFGYMLVADKSKAFAEAYRVLRPGGMFLFTTWDALEFNIASYTYRKAAKKYLGDPLPASYNLPFSMNDLSLLKSSLEDAGFSKIVVERVRKVSISETAKDATAGLAQGGLIYNEIMKRNPAWMDEIMSVVEKELSEKYGAAPMMAPMSAIVSQAWKT
jgi:ubiquinone/menaquinone biosynthesis C-methylase UbiE